MTFFDTAGEFRRWLSQNHASARELTVGFHKTRSGRGGLTYPQAVDEALCFGWIDGLRRRIDEHSYCIRFTPRKKNSIWSAVNLRHVARLKNEGRMTAAGLKVFESRNRERAGLYSFENRPKALPLAYRRELRVNAAAWKFWEAQPPWFRRTAAFWVLSGKKEETRLKRLRQLVECSARGERPPPFAY